MMIGIVGAPNKGKSTLFSAMTMADAEIADYPFTTIKPNLGVAYASKGCVEKELGVKCKPRNSLCVDGIRKLPVNVIDVAGLVPGAHLGKGMGNQFLNDLVAADALVQVVDLSGKTDVNGNASDASDPAEDVRMVKEELRAWLAGILLKHMAALSKRVDGDKALLELLSSFRATDEQVKRAGETSYLPLSNIRWRGEDASKFAGAFLELNKPIVVAANKLDKSGDAKLEELKKKLKGVNVIGCSAAIELALRKAAKSKVIDYLPGAKSFEYKGKPSKEQKGALEYMLNYIKKNNGTGVQEIVDTCVFRLFDNIVVYPVEDENKYTDHFGNVLPDAILVSKGSTALDFAGRIHTELAEKMLYGIDARKKIRIGKDYKLMDNDVIKIVSAAK
jgi:ribosome-binding ATPase